MNNMISNISIEMISQLPNLYANNLEYKYFIKTKSLKQKSGQIFDFELQHRYI